jgi:hypothetical protein
MHAEGAEAGGRPEFLEVLGLPALFDLEDVKNAYRQKVMQAHPDRGGKVADFLRLQGAYERAVEFVRIRGDGRGWIAVHTRRYVPQQQVAAEVRRRGGVVEMEEIDWLKASFGDGFAMLAERLRGIRLRGAASDDAFLEFLDEHRPGVQYLVNLDLAGGKVTDGGLTRLAGLDVLRRLDLTGTAVSGRGLTQLLGALPALEWLNVAGTRVGWWARIWLRRAHRRVTIVASSGG